jgi:AcrR family transcriptional regulator
VSVITGLRELKKVQVREQLTEVATRLFDEHGFDTVTVEQIADAAMVSPRTFFRYFGSKEAVLFADQDEILDALRAAIAGQPPASPPLEVTRAAVIALSHQYAEQREQHVRRARMAQSGAAIAAYQQTVLRPQWEDAIAHALADRLGVGVDADLRPRLFAGVALAVMEAVGPVWMAGGGTDDLDAMLEAGFETLAAATLLEPGRGR